MDFIRILLLLNLWLLTILHLRDALNKLSDIWIFILGKMLLRIWSLSLLLGVLQNQLSQKHCLLNLVLLHSFLKLSVTFDFLIKHHGHFVQLFLEVHVFVLQSFESLRHSLKLSFLLKPTFLSWFSVLKQPKIKKGIKDTDDWICM